MCKVDLSKVALAQTSKMPCASYSIPAKRCKTGSKHIDNPKSTCHKCYARKGRYTFNRVQNALERRYQAIWDPRWVQHISNIISVDVPGNKVYFRWHDSGDLQGKIHLDKIIDIAKIRQDVLFWLPTLEHSLVVRHPTAIPDNLIIRASSVYIDKVYRGGIYNKSVVIGKRYTDMSYVKATKAVEDTFKKKVYICPATFYKRIHTCGTCRACWDKSKEVIGYIKH